MSVMALFRKTSSSHSLVKAPSADLIEPDTAPKIPKQVEIECKLSPEELEKYLREIGNAEYQNIQLRMERLRHLLRASGNKQYVMDDISNFISTSSDYFYKKDGTRYIDTIEFLYLDSHGFIPPRIINRITEIRNNFTHPNNLEFVILGFKKLPSKTWLGIFFLEVKIKIKNKNDNMAGFIIDAWRGPTFSDEDARLP